jgi:tRNA threonylcarbamoyladenosine biosynthesis protein TsaB
MKILALELSTARGGVTWRDGAVEFVREWPNDRRDSGPFFNHVGEVMNQFGRPERIVVGLGPGSYAGVRIAISAAIGLQAASDAELLGAASICAMECDGGEYCVVGDARRNSFFLARVRANEIVEGPDLFAENELRDKLSEVDTPIFASEELPQLEGVTIRYPSAKILAQLAQDSRRTFLLPPLEPLYLREPHITMPRPRLL